MMRRVGSGWQSGLCTAFFMVSLLLIAQGAIAARITPAEPIGAGQDIGQQMQTLVEADWIEQDRLHMAAQQKAAGKPVLPPVSTQEDAQGGCDGIKLGCWGFHTASGEQDPWWQVDLGEVYRLDRIVIYNRCDGSRGPRLRILLATDCEGRELREVYRHDGTAFGGYTGKPLVVDLKEKDAAARSVRVCVAGKCSFALDEIEVYGRENPKLNLALGRPADQKSVGRYSYPAAVKKAVAAVLSKPKRKWAPDTAAYQAAHLEELGQGSSQVLPEPAFLPAHSRQVLARGEQLLARIGPALSAAQREPLAAGLAKAAAGIEKLEKAAEPSLDARREAYFGVRRAVRAVAFANPLLAIPKLLFIKRHASVGVFHMCDQFYGCNAKPGGGLFALVAPFGPNPKLIDLLATSAVEKGRLAGQRLQGGSFLSPEVSFDGRTILFAYTQAKAFEQTQGKEAYLWSPEFSHHLFRCNADGSHLVQLTDGDVDDFDPCWLPNGRVAFISLRRGGYLRCGRHCPTYTLFDMAADGSDIRCLSYHETHEWQPSVNHEGMIAYTRWDYVDRDSDIAHHLWTCYPDGRDPRSSHGNYPLVRESRPWMEMDIRAVPGSHRYVATAAAHHGHAFGSLVLIDPRIPDDNSMSQLTRLTPEVPFPESEGGKKGIKALMIYGTPWPLSEEDYLCAYDAQAANHGLYWLDRQGNRELIYRDPQIAAISPIPLGARPCPPVIPNVATPADGDLTKGTVAVMNVYESDFEWPAGSQIKQLRILQALAKSTAPPNQPRIGIGNQTNARLVLGTVPVEEDGSVLFEAPVGKAIYFQALNEKGLAIQSMRSVTYLHPGERLVCQGCHEHKHQPPPTGKAIPLALRRRPSKIEPEVEGSNPFSYVRLVQPVLDRNCVQCHQEKKALDLSGTIEPKYGWSRSYTNLAPKYGFYFNVFNGSIKEPVHGGSRSIAGEFGAKAAKLSEYLDERHYGLKLSPEDYHRITLWLDCNSEFYGSYENTEAQSRGEVVQPTLE